MLSHGILSAVSKGYIDAIAAAGPVAFWPSVTNTKDIVGGNDLTGTASFSGVSLVNGFDNSLYDNGALDLRANYSPFALQTFSIEFIIQTTTTTNCGIIENNQNSGFSVQTMNVSGGVSILMNKGGYAQGSISTGKITISNKTHICFTADSGGQEKAYVNGALVSTFSNPNSATYSASSYLNIGSRAGASGFVGNIAGIAFFGSVLSAQNVLDHYNAWLS